MPQNPVIEEFRSLAPLCTFGVGGPARYLIEVKQPEEMLSAFQFALQNQLRTFILGKGSNCLFDDRGFDGLVILNRIDFLQIEKPGCFVVGAGYSFSRLGSYTARNGWTGLEFASGVPASVGGAVYMNAGANNQETANTLVSVDFLSFSGIRQTLLRSDFTFAYRHSPFQHLSGAILSAKFGLEPNPEAKRQQLEIIEYRKTTQPYGQASAGCFFVNPPTCSAGKLIDSLGLKGLKVGGAEVSPRHANFIVNTGNASAQDILELAALVKEKVRELSGYELRQEVRFVPYISG